MSKTSPGQMAQTMTDNLPAKTGKSMKEWLEIVAKSGQKNMARSSDFRSENWPL